MENTAGTVRFATQGTTLEAHLSAWLALLDDVAVLEGRKPVLVDSTAAMWVLAAAGSRADLR